MPTSSQRGSLLTFSVLTIQTRRLLKLARPSENGKTVRRIEPLHVPTWLICCTGVRDIRDWRPVGANWSEVFVRARSSDPITGSILRSRPLLRTRTWLYQVRGTAHIAVGAGTLALNEGCCCIVQAGAMPSSSVKLSDCNMPSLLSVVR